SFVVGNYFNKHIGLLSYTTLLPIYSLFEAVYHQIPILRSSGLDGISNKKRRIPILFGFTPLTA
ncbi:MAG: hypothetical protein IKE28_05510, partial [Solobacterium sp.]|nr:hypothetical protein [Solobacterium sp.]